MLKFYLSQVFRNFKSYPLLFAVSVFTLFFGTLSISLLVAYVTNEMSMNKFHHKYSDIYLMVTQVSPNSRLEPIEGSLFFNFDYKKYPELENRVSIIKYPEGQIKLTYDKSSYSPEGISADSSFFQVFDFDLKIGNKKTILSDPDAMILSEKLAGKIFGKENPIGKVVRFNKNIEKTFVVKGISANVPSNSSLTFDFILPGSNDFSSMGADFLVAKAGFDKEAFVKKIEKIGEKHPQFNLSKTSLIALKETYFNDSGVDFHDLFSRQGNWKSLNILFVIIGVLLIISALNFSNLRIIKDNSSVKKFGVSKILGALNRHLLGQETLEVFFLIAFSTLVVSTFFVLLLSNFNRIVGVSLQPHFLSIMFLVFFCQIIVAILAMIYPTILLVRSPFALILKNNLSVHSQIPGRQIVVVAQFALTIALIITSVVVGKQLKMMLDKDLGFTSENIIETNFFQKLPINSHNMEKIAELLKKQKNNYNYLKDELASNPSIEVFSQNNSPLEKFAVPWKAQVQGEVYTTQNTLVVNPDHLELFGFQLIEGRFFDSAKDQSRSNKVVINDAAKKYWNIDDISKVSLNNKYWENAKGFEILGVVKDFNYEHLSVKPRPMVMMYFDDIEAPFLIKLKKGAEQSGLLFLKQLHDQLDGNEAFQYSFLSDKISDMYQKEKLLSHVYILFTLVAILISVSGLFIVALYDINRRTKEIGIRKVNGAKISEIMTLLNGDFVKLIAIAFVIATPIAWFAMHQWLQNFAYKTELSWWIFALAGLLAMGIALLTVSWQSWKAATRNPVEALRYE